MTGASLTIILSDKRYDIVNTKSDTIRPGNGVL